MCGDSGIDTIIITNPKRVARQQKSTLQGGIFTHEINEVALPTATI